MEDILIIRQRPLLDYGRVHLPQGDFTPSEIDITVMPIFDIRDVVAPPWMVEGCC